VKEGRSSRVDSDMNVHRIYPGYSGSPKVYIREAAADFVIEKQEGRRSISQELSLGVDGCPCHRRTCCSDDNMRGWVARINFGSFLFIDKPGFHGNFAQIGLE
jgi:hypothetical protein